MDDVVPLLRGHPPHGLVHGDAGVVDQDVQVPALVQDLADDADAVVVRADVARVDGDAVVGVLVAELLGGIVIGGVSRPRP